MKYLIPLLLLVSSTAFGQVQYAPFRLLLSNLRTDGLQTNMTELARFTALSGSGQYATSRANVKATADARIASWPYDIQAGAWEDDNTNNSPSANDPNDDCEPVGDILNATAHDVETAATDILAMAITGVVENTASYHTNAATHLLEFAQTTGFEFATLDGSNQCILDISTIGFNLIEAALLVDAANLATWTPENRITFSNWLVSEVFPLVTWSAQNRKNNWSPLALSTSIAIAAYVENHTSLLVDWNSVSHTPTQYIADADDYLDAILSRTSNVMDSECVSVSPFIYGVQSHGGNPDELRRTGGTANCGQTSLTFACPGGICDSGAGFYSSKFANGITRTCEALRRIDGHGNRCFEKTLHGGDDQTLLDMIQFATGNYTYQAIATTQGLKYVGAEYYRVPALRAMTDEAGTVERGGRDFAYTRLTHAPGVAYNGYVWNLGSLATYADRFNIDWDHSKWANGYDSEIEMNAKGWPTVNIANNPCIDSSPVDGRCDSAPTTYSFTCASGGASSNQDRLAMVAMFTDNCNTSAGTAYPGFDTGVVQPLVCNNVFKIAANCTIDVLPTNVNIGTADPALYIRYSNYALIGTNKTTSRLVSTYQMVNNINGAGSLLGISSDNWPLNFPNEPNETPALATYTWTSGLTLGTTQITLSGACPAARYENPDDGDGLNENALIKLVGTDADGAHKYMITRITSKGTDGLSNCVLTLEDPIHSTFASAISVRVLDLGYRTQYHSFHNLTIGWPYLEPGYCTAEGTPQGQGCVSTMHIDSASNTLFDNVIMDGPTPFSPVRTYQFVMRHSTWGPHRHAQRRPNNNNFLRLDRGSFTSVYNNTYRPGFTRVASIMSGAWQAGVITFNYQAPQIGPNTWDTATTTGFAGDYCQMETAPGGTYPSIGGGPERAIFPRHDSDWDGGPLSAVGGFLVESNEFKCRVYDESNFTPMRRYATFFRNRLSGNVYPENSFVASTNWQFPIAAYASTHYAMIANIAPGSWTVSNNYLLNGLGLYNVANYNRPMAAPTATGLIWPTTGTGKNYLDAAGPHDDYQADGSGSLLPPSLAFRNDYPPSFWCTESGPWDNTWSFAYADRGDNGGVARRLPAQIRYDGGTCTKPVYTVDYGTVLPN